MKAERADAHFAAALRRTGSAVRERVMAAIVQQKGGEEAALVVQFEQMVRNGEADLQAHPEGQGKCRVWQRIAPAWEPS